ncbi:MAG: radical SAM protein [Candidatus Woesebacteria bacterium]|nr:MAG: radical SAM protein [Candidatus Woesebacteria bacterium]
MSAENSRIEVLRTTLGEPPTELEIRHWQGLPRSVNLDVVENICNLACPHCPLPERMLARTKALHRGEEVRPPFMDARVLFRALDEIATWPTKPALQLTANGEPLMHPRIVDIVKYSTDRNFRIGMTTNGILLDDQMALQLLQANISMINVSVDSPREDLYSIVRKSQSGTNYFQTVIKNISNLVNRRELMKKDGRKVGTKIMMNMILRPETEGIVDEFVKLAAKLGVDSVSMRPLNSNAGLTGQENVDEVKIVDGVITEMGNLKRWPCHFPFLRVSLAVGNEDGQIRVTWCPHGWDRQEFDIGMFPEDGKVEELWNSPKMQEIRKNHLSQTIPTDSPCAKCTDWHYITRTGKDQKTYADIIR